MEGSGDERCQGEEGEGDVGKYLRRSGKDGGDLVMMKTDGEPAVW